eukprot:GEZU01021491.1.p1 GENE.GEZU01021491.1~~GEZU01021491.1.p1  ORF type:complete len:100 (+),score=20.87 GEZU01021491.1:242-541(+)
MQAVQEAATKLTVPQLYRRILKAARYFPSMKRDSLIADIKAEFHEKKNEKDPKKIANYIAMAEGGLERLEVYSSMGTRPQHKRNINTRTGRDADWSITL